LSVLREKATDAIVVWKGSYQYMEKN
jgi:hypothetical protein